MNLFARAAAGYALSASERAVLRLIKSFIVAACVATWPVFNAFLTAVTTSDLRIDYSGWLANLAKAFVVALALAVQKYHDAQADAGKAANQQATNTTPPPPATDAPASPSYAAPDTPQPPPADTPVQVVPVVSDATPATPQVAESAT